MTGPTCLFGRCKLRSCTVCRLLQNSGEVPKASASSQAVSGEIPRLPLMISFTRCTGIFRWVASARCVSSRGSRNSFWSMTPGWVAVRFDGIICLASSWVVIVHDFNIIGVGCLPAKNNTPLRIDPNAVTSAEHAMKRFKPATRGHPQIFQGGGRIQQIELAGGNIQDLRRIASNFSVRNPVKQGRGGGISK
jgi:hypothetical protein